MAKRAFLVLLAVLVTGCGGGGGGASSASSAKPSGSGIESLSPKETVDQAVQALKEARSAHLAGQVVDGGRVSLDLTADTSGNCSGTVSQTGQGSFQVVKLGKQVWIKPDQAFWQTHGDPATAQLVGDKYLKTTSDNPDFAELTSLCDLGSLADSILKDDGLAAAGSRTTLDGAPVVTVQAQKDGVTGTMYVAATGRPYPLRIEKAGSRLDLKEFGVPVPSTTPSPDQSIDLDQLNGETGGASPTPSAV